jgi:hypothetical protein
MMLFCNRAGEVSQVLWPDPGKAWRQWPLRRMWVKRVGLTMRRSLPIVRYETDIVRSGRLVRFVPILEVSASLAFGHVGMPSSASAL